jgi:hypothetical protein
MSMTREEHDFMKQVSNETKAERRAAISAAGPFLDAVRRAQLQRTLLDECRLSPTQADAVIGKISADADDDAADPQQVVVNALNPLIKNKSFVSRVSLEMARVVQDGLDARDEKIVAAGGPKRPGPGWTMNI